MWALDFQQRLAQRITAGSQTCKQYAQEVGPIRVTHRGIGVAVGNGRDDSPENVPQAPLKLCMKHRQLAEVAAGMKSGILASVHSPMSK
jgi:hypothetical protein